MWKNRTSAPPRMAKKPETPVRAKAAASLSRRTKSPVTPKPIQVAKETSSKNSPRRITVAAASAAASVAARVKSGDKQAAVAVKAAVKAVVERARKRSRVTRLVSPSRKNGMTSPPSSGSTVKPSPGINRGTSPPRRGQVGKPACRTRATERSRLQQPSTHLRTESPRRKLLATRSAPRSPEGVVALAKSSSKPKLIGSASNKPCLESQLVSSTNTNSNNDTESNNSRLSQGRRQCAVSSKLPPPPSLRKRLHNARVRRLAASEARVISTSATTGPRCAANGAAGPAVAASSLSSADRVLSAAGATGHELAASLPAASSPEADAALRQQKPQATGENSDCKEKLDKTPEQEKEKEKEQSKEKLEKEKENAKEKQAEQAKEKAEKRVEKDNEEIGKSDRVVEKNNKKKADKAEKNKSERKLVEKSKRKNLKEKEKDEEEEDKEKEKGRPKKTLRLNRRGLHSSRVSTRERTESSSGAHTSPTKADASTGSAPSSPNKHAVQAATAGKSGRLERPAPLSANKTGSANKARPLRPAALAGRGSNLPSVFLRLSQPKAATVAGGADSAAAKRRDRKRLRFPALSSSSSTTTANTNEPHTRPKKSPRTHPRTRTTSSSSTGPHRANAKGARIRPLPSLERGDERLNLLRAPSPLAFLLREESSPPLRDALKVEDLLFIISSFAGWKALVVLSTVDRRSVEFARSEAGWRLLCDTLCVTCGLYLPPDRRSMFRDSNGWIRYFWEHLFPARGKWNRPDQQPRTQHGPAACQLHVLARVAPALSAASPASTPHAPHRDRSVLPARPSSPLSDNGFSDSGAHGGVGPDMFHYNRRARPRRSSVKKLPLPLHQRLRLAREHKKRSGSSTISAEAWKQLSDEDLCSQAVAHLVPHTPRPETVAALLQARNVAAVTTSAWADRLTGLNGPAEQAEEKIGSAAEEKGNWVGQQLPEEEREEEAREMREALLRARALHGTNAPREAAAAVAAGWVAAAERAAPFNWAAHNHNPPPHHNPNASFNLNASPALAPVDVHVDVADPIVSSVTRRSRRHGWHRRRSRRRTGAVRLISVEPSCIVMYVPGPGLRQFFFARVLDSTTPPGQVYDRSTRAAVAAALNGRNSAVLSYGSEIAKEDEHMFGSAAALQTAWELQRENEMLSELPGTLNTGLALRACREILWAFSNESNCLPGVDASVGMQFIEVHPDHVVDICTGQRHTAEQSLGSGWTSAHTQPITSLRDVLSLLLRRHALWHVRDPAGPAGQHGGGRADEQAAPLQHHPDQFAHTVLILWLRQIHRSAQRCVLTRLFLVDLAPIPVPPHQPRSTDPRLEAEMAAWRMKASEVTSTFHALDKCLDAVRTGRPHVPYLESKLTTLLQPVLKGSNTSHSHITALLNCSEDPQDAEWTLKALRFGERCCSVLGQPQKITPTHETVLATVDGALQSALKHLRMLRPRLGRSPPPPPPPAPQVSSGAVLTSIIPKPAAGEASSGASTEGEGKVGAVKEESSMAGATQQPQRNPAGKRNTRTGRGEEKSSASGDKKQKLSEGKQRLAGRHVKEAKETKVAAKALEKTTSSGSVENKGEAGQVGHVPALDSAAANLPQNGPASTTVEVQRQDPSEVSRSPAGSYFDWLVTSFYQLQQKRNVLDVPNS
eukprot:g29821.t1